MPIATTKTTTGDDIEKYLWWCLIRKTYWDDSSFAEKPWQHRSHASPWRDVVIYSARGSEEGMYDKNYANYDENHDSTEWNADGVAGASTRWLISATSLPDFSIPLFQTVIKVTVHTFIVQARVAPTGAKNFINHETVDSVFQLSTP